MSDTHALTRTSPKGGPFIGTCMKCGRTGLTLRQASEECENPSRMTQDEAVIAAVSPEMTNPVDQPKVSELIEKLRSAGNVLKWIETRHEVGREFPPDITPAVLSGMEQAVHEAANALSALPQPQATTVGITVWPEFTAPPMYPDAAEGWKDPLLPDYRLIWKVARECGYSVGLHGSMKRDCDLIAVPWVADAKSADELIHALSAALNAQEVGERENKPHGRLGVNLQIDGWFKLIDLSIASALIGIPGAEKGEAGTVIMPIEPTDAMLLRMMNELHANLPEVDRPGSRSDFSKEQWARVCKAYHALLVTSLQDDLVAPPAPTSERVQALESALKPFAAMWDENVIDGTEGRPDNKIAWGFNNAEISWGDFRRARAALKATP